MAAANRWKANAAIIALSSDASNEAYGGVGQSRSFHPGYDRWHSH